MKLKDLEDNEVKQVLAVWLYQIFQDYKQDVEKETISRLVQNIINEFPDVQVSQLKAITKHIWKNHQHGKILAPQIFAYVHDYLNKNKPTW